MEGSGKPFPVKFSFREKPLLGHFICYIGWLRKKWLTQLSFIPLKDLAIRIGCEYLRELSLGGNAQYNSEQTVAELLHCLSQAIEEKILFDLQSSEFFSLMTDESTDISVLKQLVLVGKYLTRDGVRTSFLTITDIPNGTAETIEGVMLNFMREKGLQIIRLCDGAAVMTGKWSGVAVRLRSHSPRMISVHCISHRLALAAAHASDKIPYLKKFKSILQTLFYFYQNSAVRMASLRNIQEILNESHIKCKQAIDVCWLSHDNAIKAVIRSLPALLVSLDREASENVEPTAHGLFKFMKCYKFVATAHLLSDILPHLSCLSRIFQKEDVDLSLIHKSTIDTISKYKESPGPNLSKVDEVISSDLKDFSFPVTNEQREQFKCAIQAKVC